MIRFLILGGLFLRLALRLALISVAVALLALAASEIIARRLSRSV